MTTLGKTLAGLNVLAAIAFAILLSMAYGKRQSASYAVFRHDLALMGLPLEEENVDPSTAPDRILSQHLDDSTLKAVFDSVGGQPVKTLEKEIQQLQSKLPNELETAAGEVVGEFTGKNETDKRNGLRSLLLPLARNGPQVDSLEQKISTAKGATLETLIHEAAKRRVINELLDPLQQLVPVDVKDDPLPRIVELDAKQGQFVIPIAVLDDFLSERVKLIASPTFEGANQETVKWDPVKRRQIVSDLIFAVTHLTKPRADGKLSEQLINPQGPDRAEAVLGLIQYNISTDRYAKALQQITRRIDEAIAVDRDGVKGKIPGFVTTYDNQVARMRLLAEDVKDRQQRLEALKLERKKVEDDLRDRKVHQDEVVKKIMDNRAETLKLAQELQRVQQQLFLAQREMSTAFEDNQRMERQIRELEGLNKRAP
jgi:hypothetical protein